MELKDYSAKTMNHQLTDKSVRMGRNAMGAVSSRGRRETTRYYLGRKTFDRIVHQGSKRARIENDVGAAGKCRENLPRQAIAATRLRNGNNDVSYGEMETLCRNRDITGALRDRHWYDDK